MYAERERERDFTTFLQIQNSQGRGESFTMFTFDLIMGLDIN